MAGEFPLHRSYSNYIKVMSFLFQENYFTYLSFQVVGQTIASPALACLWKGLQRVVKVG